MMSSFAEYFKMSGILNRQGFERKEMRGKDWTAARAFLTSAIFTLICRFLKYHV